MTIPYPTKEPIKKNIALGNGLVQHTLFWGDHHPSKPLIVLIHGFLDSAWSWEYVAPTLATHFDVIAPDLRGHGESARVGAGGYYHFVDYLADLHFLLKEVTNRPIHLVGHSLGGVIAGFFAGTYPEKIETLVLCEGLGPKESTFPLPDRIVKWLKTWEQQTQRDNRIYKDVDQAKARLQQTDPLLTESVARRLAERLTMPHGEGVVFKHDPLHMTRAPYPFLVPTAGVFWQRIKTPTLLVEGEKSRFRKSDDEYAKRLSFIDSKTLRTIPNAGHWMQLHQPTKLAELILEHIQ